MGNRALAGRLGKWAAAALLIGASWTLQDWLARTDEASLDWICSERYCQATAPERTYSLTGEPVWLASRGPEPRKE